MQDQKLIALIYNKHGEEPIFQSAVNKIFQEIKDNSLWPHKQKGDVERRCQMYIMCRLSNTQPHVLLRSLKKHDQLQKIANKHKVRTTQFGFRNWKYLRKPELKPRSDGLIQAFMHISNQAHQTNLRGKLNLKRIFNVTDLVPFIADESDLRSNLSEEGGDDTSMDGAVMDKLEPEEGAKEQLEPEELQGALELPVGAITRLRAKKLKQAVSTLLSQAESNLSNRAYPTTLVVIQAN